MNKIELINKWSNKNINNLINKIIEHYSNNNKLNLINLEQLNDKNTFYYWYICMKSSEIYLFYINNKSKINKSDNNLINKSDNYIDIKTILNKINRFYCKQVDINYNIFNNRLFKKTHIINYDNNNYIINDIKINTIRIIDYITDITEPLNKKRKNNTMISASSIKNYMLNDSLIDYLKEYNIKTIYDKPIFNNRNTFITNYNLNNNEVYSDKSVTHEINKQNYNLNDKNEINKNIFINTILNSGVTFENELINILAKDHKIIKVSEHYDSLNIQKFNETINYMKSGVPIIYQGVLHNYENNTFGLPDLLVRSDYINKLLKYNVISDEESLLPSPKLNINYHYKVIDIKHSMINLKSDSIHISNTHNIPAYKGQLYIYTKALNNILGININKAFIWGKKYDFINKNKKYIINDFLKKLGTIDYDNIDIEYVTFSNNAIEWIKLLKLNGHNWSLFPVPSCNELYPNMKNNKNNNYKFIKYELSNNIYEITNIWNCGIKNRINAHYNNIFGWNDILCTAKNMGFNNNKTSIIIDKILDINRQDIDIIRPSKILFDRINWDTNDNSIFEFYLDFETLNTNYESMIYDNIINYNNNEQYIFMIGVGYYKNNNWIFENFIMENKTYYSELIMYNNFINYIDNICKTHNKTKCKFYHWSSAESNIINKFISKHNLKINDNYIFYDLYNVFISEPITIKNALNFSLKTIAKALYNHKLILSNWDNSSICSDGLNAMILANKLYNYNNTNSICNDPIMKDIKYYNEIDCKVLMEIHNLLKNKL